MPTVLPQPIGNHPTTQGLARDRATVMLGQLLRRQRRAKVGVSLAHDRQRQRANLSRESMVTGSAAMFGKQARGPVLLEAAQQTKHLTPLQPNQHAGVTDTQTTRLNPQQHVKTAELLLAHRQHRHGAPPGTPEPAGVSPLYCRGVSSLYGAYIKKSENTRSGKITLWGTISREGGRSPQGRYRAKQSA